jgi:5'-3' exonuclease
MKFGKHTLLIDGNYFVYSRLFVLPKPKAGEALVGTEDGKAQFMRKLAIDFASEMRKLSGIVDEVVVAVDSKSWRKDLYPAEEYKGTRTQDSSVDWEGVYSVYKEFTDLLATFGVKIQKTNGAEADDIIYSWTSELINRGKSSIIWTGDRDLVQLVDYTDAADCHVLWYDSARKRLYAYEGFVQNLSYRDSEHMSADDLMFNMASHIIGGSDAIKQNIASWIDSNKISVDEINCDEYMMAKLLVGDKSDNIQAVVTWQKTIKGGKIRNFALTDQHAYRVVEQYKKEAGKFHIEDMFVSQCVDNIVDIVYRVVGMGNKPAIKSRLSTNMSLMLLHNNTIPEGIQKACSDQCIALLDKNEVTLFETLSDFKKMLKDTDYVKEIVPKSFDPFAALNVSNTETKRPGEDTKTTQLF